MLKDCTHTSVKKASVLHKLHTGKHINTPFIHKFRTEQNSYIYDVNTMNIIRVDKVLWEIISDFGKISKAEIISKYSDSYKPAEISSAYGRIADAQRQKRLFLSRYPKIVMPFTEKNLREKLAGERTILLLNVTENCNFNCSYCVYGDQYLNRRNSSKKSISWSIAKKAVDAFLEQSGNAESRSIAFYGGEPLLNMPLIHRVVSYIRANEGNAEIRFTLTTNGSLLRDETADFLAGEDFIINVSLDGPEKIHNRYRRTKTGQPTWQDIISNVKVFLKKHPQYKTNGRLSYNAVIAPPLDITELEKFFSSYELFYRDMLINAGFVESIGAKGALKGTVSGSEELERKFVDNLAAGRINADPGAAEYRFQKVLYEAKWLKFHKRFSRYGCPVHGVRSFSESFCLLSTCIPGVRRTFVSVDGNYWPCERVSESEYLKIGNVNRGFDIPKIKQLLEDWVDLSKDQCGHCWSLRTCQVGCWSNVSNGDKPTASLKKKACREHRLITHKLLIDYCYVLERNPKALDYMQNITFS